LIEPTKSTKIGIQRIKCEFPVYHGEKSNFSAISWPEQVNFQ